MKAGEAPQGVLARLARVLEASLLSSAPDKTAKLRKLSFVACYAG